MNLYKAVIEKSFNQNIEVYVPAEDFASAELKVKKATLKNPTSMEVICETYEDWRGGLIFD